MPKRWCQCPGCQACQSPDRRPGSHGALYDLDTTGTLKCPPCQQIATTKRNQRPSSSARGYDGEYQRNKQLIIEQGRNGRPCVICHKPFTPEQKITAEHLVPRRNGGGSELGNLGPAHAWCNTAWNKGHRRS